MSEFRELPEGGQEHRTEKTTRDDQRHIRLFSEKKRTIGRIRRVSPPATVSPSATAKKPDMTDTFARSG